MGISFVWVTGLRCNSGHNLEAQSHARRDYRGFPPDAVPLDVAEDLRDHPFYCGLCVLPLQEALQATLDEVGRHHEDCVDRAYRRLGATFYQLRFTGAPRPVCEHCGAWSGCGCFKVVAVAVEEAP